MTMLQFIESAERFHELDETSRQLIRQLAKNANNVDLNDYSIDAARTAYHYFVQITNEAAWGAQLYREAARLIQRLFYYIQKWEATKRGDHGT